MTRNTIALHATRPLLAVLAGLGMLLAGGYAAAQTSDAITVVAPHRITHKDVGTTYSGVPIEQISLSHQVGYSDLDLSTPAGAAALRQRVAVSAKHSCTDLERLYPEGLDEPLPKNMSCVDAAVKGALPQVEAAIQAARK